MKSISDILISIAFQKKEAFVWFIVLKFVNIFNLICILDLFAGFVCWICLLDLYAGYPKTKFQSITAFSVSKDIQHTVISIRTCCIRFVRDIIHLKLSLELVKLLRTVSLPKLECQQKCSPKNVLKCKSEYMKICD